MMESLQDTMLRDTSPTTMALTGRRVLIVEDEWMVTTLLEEFLADIGCEVAGVASRLRDAFEKIDAVTFDVAILDVNLNGEQTLPVADALVAAGRPIVFATGYAASTVPAKFAAVPVLQ